uniref:non-specific serine/threonine protein kinase n=1 Tax=Fagus sylvatica TaxID=28930 RepID=A0A2N9FSD1_FAGSY
MFASVSHGRKQHKVGRFIASQPIDRCDSYGVCGAYGRCIITESPVCQCLNGFKPKSQQKWDSMDWSQGCVRNKPLNCQEIITHGFVKFPNLKVPDTTYTWVNTSMNLKECREKCLSNCSCTAYTNSDIKEGIGCAIWFGDLLDIKQFPDGGQDLYIRMHPSELGIMERMRTIVHSSNSKGPEEDMELPLFDLSTIARATDDFSLNNKLGEGGFGPVYKGTLLEGKDIAVKRLSKSSGQGLNEFKNEVNLIAKLQHRNLVKLLGSCIQENEKMLIYEYMPNKSLDSFIFGLNFDPD